MNSNYLWFLIYEHTFLKKSDNEDSLACKVLIGPNLENSSRDFVIEDKCQMLELCPKVLMKSKKRVKEMES